MVKRFSEELMERMPEGMQMPLILVEVMDWLEAQGARQTTWQGEALKFERQSLALYPVAEWQQPGASHAAFSYYGTFSLNGPPAPVVDEDERVFLFVQTGGDGSYAGFWLDDRGKQWIVHHGSGSGSVWFGVISDDPKDLLRLLAVGYEEPAFAEVHALTPLEAMVQGNGLESVFHLAQMIAADRLDGAEGIADFEDRRDDLAEDLADQMEAGERVADGWGLPIPPVAFQTCLREVHGIATPRRASDFLPFPASDGADPGDDPFYRWLTAHQPEPSDEAQGRLKELDELAEEMIRQIDAGKEPDPELLRRMEALSKP